MKKIETNESQLVYNIIMELNGQQVYQAKELLDKVSVVLGVANSPIDSDRIKDSWFPEFKKRKSIFKREYLHSNGYDYVSIDYVHALTLYQQTNYWYSRIFPNRYIFYRMNNGTQITPRRLTIKNLIQDFKKTRYEQRILTYLLTNGIYKKGITKNSYKILEVFNP